ncbi:MAG: hypothetical protein A3I68_05860 [Candidatus Melainabacteria bacterium RIFCSPLOWO2_02_FULL_35_15]|nr:MAG: hypothetical protein A3F80_05145 [Candidatus Melainabacteria bacterium RIFCSPLOWO2_12_FULL_35_11]OGI13891.1 MAG: hypothetical protein A3I68_05860 [Candidatus Melainabacteria bacterium RIFCSPLOWO2_02_FULL_35_15]
MITKEQIQELAKKFSIDWYSIMREYLQIVFLASLYESKSSQDVYFKGGTAIRLLLNSFRFSEDLDFTVRLHSEDIEKLVIKTVEKMKLTVPNIAFKKLKTIHKSYSGSLQFKDEEYKSPVNIHLEFSYREKPLTQKESVLETLFPVNPYPLIIHLSWNEILAEKIRALMTRTKGRDLFDTWYLMSKGTEIDLSLINKKMALYGRKITKEDIVNKVKNFNYEILEGDLNKYLPATHRKLTEQLKEILEKKLI